MSTTPLNLRNRVSPRHPGFWYSTQVYPDVVGLTVRVRHSVFLETPGVHNTSEFEKPSVSKTPGFWYSTQVYPNVVGLTVRVRHSVFLETPGVHNTSEFEKPSVSKTPGFWYSTQVYPDVVGLTVRVRHSVFPKKHQLSIPIRRGSLDLHRRVG